MTRRAVFVLSLIVSVSTAWSETNTHDSNATKEFQAARQTVIDLDWKSAARLYEPLREQTASGSKEWDEATYALATALLQVQPLSAGLVNRADSLYAEVIEISKDDRYVARALISRGRIAELTDYLNDPVDLAAARGFYQQVMTRFPGEPIGSEAALRAGATLIMTYDAPSFSNVREGIALLEKWQADHPNNPLASVIWQYLGDSYFIPLDDKLNALRCYEEVDRIGWADQGNQGPAYWRCAVLADRFLGRPEVAIKYYTKIINETPNSGKAYESLEALQRLGAPLPDAPLLKEQK